MKKKNAVDLEFFSGVVLPGSKAQFTEHISLFLIKKMASPVIAFLPNVF